MLRNSLALAALLLSGCDGASVGNRTQRSGDATLLTPDRVDANTTDAVSAAGAPMAWRVVEGAAFYGAADQPPAFGLRCDRANEQIVFERAGSGTALNLSAGGRGVTLGTRAGTEGRVQARTGMHDSVLDAMSRSQTQISVSGTGDAINIPGGVAIRRVVDFCRNPPAPPEPEPTDTPATNNMVVTPPVLVTPQPMPTGQP